MDVDELLTFLAVVQERSFSRAAWRLHRSQPVVSLTVSRLERELGESLFDRSSKGGMLTEAGKLFRGYAEQVVALSENAKSRVRELKDLRRGRVVIGANEGAVNSLLPLIATFSHVHPQILVEVRRIRARDVGADVAKGGLDFGVTTYKPTGRQLRSIPLGDDEMVVIVRPDHPFAKHRKVTLKQWAAEPIIVHSDPSPSREKVLRLVEQRHQAFNAHITLPTLEGIKRAVEMGLGISLLPSRCVLEEVARGSLATVTLPELRMPSQVRLVCRRTGVMSHAATAFLKIATEARHKTSPKGKKSDHEVALAGPPRGAEPMSAG